MKQPTTGGLPCNKNEYLTNKNDQIRGYIYIYNGISDIGISYIYIHKYSVYIMDILSDLLILAIGYQWENNCESILFDQIFKRIWLQTIGIYSTQMVVEWYASWGYYAAYGHILSYIGKVEEYEYDMPMPILKNYRISKFSHVNLSESELAMEVATWYCRIVPLHNRRFRQCVFHPIS